MIHKCVEALARLSRQEDVRSSEERSLGAGGMDSGRMIHEEFSARAIKILAEYSVETREQLDGMLADASLSELKELLTRVDEEIPNPFQWQPPEDNFCSFCSRRPSWWNDFTIAPPGDSGQPSLKTLRQSKGYHWHRPEDPEDGPGEWRYKGEPVMCETCELEADKDSPWSDDATMQYWSDMLDPGLDEEAAERYGLESAVTYCLAGSGWDS